MSSPPFSHVPKWIHMPWVSTTPTDRHGDRGDMRLDGFQSVAVSQDVIAQAVQQAAAHQRRVKACGDASTASPSEGPAVISQDSSKAISRDVPTDSPIATASPLQRPTKRSRSSEADIRARELNQVLLDWYNGDLQQTASTIRISLPPLQGPDSIRGSHELSPAGGQAPGTTSSHDGMHKPHANWCKILWPTAAMAVAAVLLSAVTREILDHGRRDA